MKVGYSLNFFYSETRILNRIKKVFKQVTVFDESTNVFQRNLDIFFVSTDSLKIGYHHRQLTSF